MTNLNDVLASEHINVNVNVRNFRDKNHPLTPINRANLIDWMLGPLIGVARAEARHWARDPNKRLDLALLRVEALLEVRDRLFVQAEKGAVVNIATSIASAIESHNLPKSYEALPWLHNYEHADDQKALLSILQDLAKIPEAVWHPYIGMTEVLNGRIHLLRALEFAKSKHISKGFLEHVIPALIADVQGDFPVLRNGMITYATKRDHLYDSDKRVPLLPARYIRRRLMDADDRTIPDVDLEYFCKDLTEHFERPQVTVSHLYGKDLVKAYADDVGCPSCMTGEARSSALSLYRTNPDKVCLVVGMGDDGSVSRALLWTCDDGTKVLDRVYPGTDEGLNNWAAENGYLIHHYVLHARLDWDRTLTVTMTMPEEDPDDGYPYMDTFVHAVVNRPAKRIVLAASRDSARLRARELYGYPEHRMVYLYRLVNTFGRAPDWQTCGECGNGAYSRDPITPHSVGISASGHLCCAVCREETSTTTSCYLCNRRHNTKVMLRVMVREWGNETDRYQLVCPSCRDSRTKVCGRCGTRVLKSLIVAARPNKNYKRGVLAPRWVRREAPVLELCIDCANEERPTRENKKLMTCIHCGVLTNTDQDGIFMCDTCAATLGE